jgi:hypothetical protein
MRSASLYIATADKTVRHHTAIEQVFEYQVFVKGFEPVADIDFIDIHVDAEVIGQIWEWVVRGINHTEELFRPPMPLRCARCLRKTWDREAQKKDDENGCHFHLYMYPM